MTRRAFPARDRLLALAIGMACATGLPTALAADATPAPKPPAKAAAKAPAKATDSKPREGSLGKGTGPLLSREQLRQCLAEQDRLKKATAEVLELQHSFEKNRGDIERLGGELEAEKTTLDRTSQAAVDAYNEKARGRGKLIEDYKAAAPQFNERVDKLTDDKHVFAKDCADRKYLEADYDDIKAGK